MLIENLQSAIVAIFEALLASVYFFFAEFAAFIAALGLT
jgi:hypothetical protein